MRFSGHPDVFYECSQTLCDLANSPNPPFCSGVVHRVLTDYCRYTCDPDGCGEPAWCATSISLCDLEHVSRNCPVTCAANTPPPPPVAAPPPPPAATTHSTGFLAGSTALVMDGFSEVNPTSCMLGGGLIGAEATIGLIVETSNTNSDGTGTYFCSVQTGTQLNMVQFEITRSATGVRKHQAGGPMYARPIAAGFVADGSRLCAESEALFGSATQVPLANSAAGTGCGLADLTYNAGAASAGSGGTCEDKYASLQPV